MVKIWVSEADVYKAIERDCGYRGRQHITGWWSNGYDDIAFDNNRKEWGAEHYTPNGFMEVMRRYIPEVKEAKCNQFKYDYKKYKRGFPLGEGGFCFYRDNNNKEV